MINAYPLGSSYGQSPISAVATVCGGRVPDSPSFPTDTVIILAVVPINAVLGVLQESKAKKGKPAVQYNN